MQNAIYNINNITNEEKYALIQTMENNGVLDENDLTKLEYLAKDKDDEIRGYIASVLILSNSIYSEKILKNLMNDKDELVRANACDSLGSFSSAELINLMKDHIQKDKSSLVRGYAALSLVDISQKLADRTHNVRIYLDKFYRKEKVKWVKYNYSKALYLLSNDFEYYELLVSGIDDIRYRNRCLVANLLGSLVVDKVVSLSDINMLYSKLGTRLKVERTIAARNSFMLLREKITETYNLDSH